jgi:hypothetical protein
MGRQVGRQGKAGRRVDAAWKEWSDRDRDRGPTGFIHEDITDHT